MKQLDFKSYVILFLLFVVIVLAVKSGCDQRASEKHVAALINELASQSRTTEIADGVYQRLAMRIDDLDESLAQVSGDHAKLMKMLADSDSKLAALADVSISLRDSVATGKADHHVPTPSTQPVQPSTQPIVPSTQPDSTREYYAFDSGEQFEYYRVDGILYPKTNDVTLWSRWLKPIKATVALTKSPDGKWATTVTAEDGVLVDIDTSAIDGKLKFDDSRFIDRFSLVTDLSVTKELDELQVGASILYDVGPADLGVRVGFDGSMSFGISASWNTR